MPPLLSFHRAVLDIRKLRDYALNPDNPRGRHKARVLRSVLGVTASDAEWFRAEILRQLPFSEAIPMSVDSHGARFRVDMLVTRLDRRAVIRTTWIVEPGTDTPRMTSCWVF